MDYNASKAYVLTISNKSDKIKTVNLFSMNEKQDKDLEILSPVTPSDIAITFQENTFQSLWNMYCQIKFDHELAYQECTKEKFASIGGHSVCPQ
jgi:hypothetical protein